MQSSQGRYFCSCISSANAMHNANTSESLAFVPLLIFHIISSESSPTYRTRFVVEARPNSYRDCLASAVWYTLWPVQTPCDRSACYYLTIVRTLINQLHLIVTTKFVSSPYYSVDLQKWECNNIITLWINPMGKSELCLTNQGSAYIAWFVNACQKMTEDDRTLVNRNHWSEWRDYRECTIQGFCLIE